MSSNNVLFPDGTYCPSEYVGTQAFIVSLEDLKAASESVGKEVSDQVSVVDKQIKALVFQDAALGTFRDNIITSNTELIKRFDAKNKAAEGFVGGLVHSLMVGTIRDLLKTKKYVIFSWQDLSGIINLLHDLLNAKQELAYILRENVQLYRATVGANPIVSLSPSQRNDYSNLNKLWLFIEQLRHNIIAFFISKLLNDITPVVVMTQNTLGMNLDTTARVPLSLDNFDGLSYNIIKVQNVGDIMFNTSYFRNTLNNNEAFVTGGLYYLVPKVEDHEIDLLNAKSIRAAKLSMPIGGGAYIASSYSTGSEVTISSMNSSAALEMYLDTLDYNSRKNYPIYTRFSKLNSFTFGTCISKHVNRPYVQLTESDWFTFNPLAYHVVGLRLRAVQKRAINVPQHQIVKIIGIVPPANAFTGLTTIPAGNQHVPFFNNPVSNTRGNNRTTQGSRNPRPSSNAPVSSPAVSSPAVSSAVSDDAFM